MKKTASSLLVFLCISISIFAQKSVITLTFKAGDELGHVQLDSILILNRTQGGDTVLYWTDTILYLGTVGISHLAMDDNSFKVFQNYPNPVIDQTTIKLFIPEKDYVSIVITDFYGRQIVKTEQTLKAGHHAFRFVPGAGQHYLFTAVWKDMTSSIRIISLNPGTNRSARLDYTGHEPGNNAMKESATKGNFVYEPGDALMYVGYGNSLESGMIDTPENDTIYNFMFAYNIPCIGTPTVDYGGQLYNAVQIFSQCWLQENLNVGTMIYGGQLPSNNSTIEKWCYENGPDSCTMYGGLYKWEELMNYDYTPGSQGICPPGWHVPTNDEWLILEGIADSQFGVGNPEWEEWGNRGLDAGMILKSTSDLWINNGQGSDNYNFSAMPGGNRSGMFGNFNNLGTYAYYWCSSSLGNNVPYRAIAGGNNVITLQQGSTASSGFSARCVKD